ncbi:MAG TPA: FtsL-like putative cell division protein [Bacteroidia bacterium]|nr:FtsL-like putative cell division protein [Bacteroidia bacterium]
MNQFKEKNESKESKKSTSSAGAHRLVARVNPFGYLTAQNIVRMLPLFFFLVFLSIIYIANTYSSERTIREINQLKDELKEMRSEYLTTKSELMLMSRQSSVFQNVEHMGIKESTIPPKKIETLKQNPEHD